MHPFRTHTCGELRIGDVDSTVRVSGWIHSKRDHGGLLFIDLRDHYGITQCVLNLDHKDFELDKKARDESVITITGRVAKRSEATVNPNLGTGEIELRVDEIEVQSSAEVLPFQVASEDDASEELRLRYRYLDLRREQMHSNILLRSRIITSLRRRMTEIGFVEFQTPILTASSPEGARDYLVPSRRNPGKFYALPQAPQQFKQLLMVSGFDKYFQIAPCFRDEDGRADRSPGEFYQLDIEMSYCTQDDVFSNVEKVMHGVFKEFGGEREICDIPFPRVPYAEAMLKYASDKPDLRNPLVMSDVTEAFRGSDFGIFAKAIEDGAVVRALPAKGAESQPRSFFDKLNDWARDEGAGGLAYIVFMSEGTKGPIAKKLDEERIALVKSTTGVQAGDAVFFICGQPRKITQFAAAARERICDQLNLREENAFRFCWIVDFPMYELDEETRKVAFSHNPFSMPQGGLEALETQDPLDIKAYQYDIVCNGVELSSGAIRNHRPDIMVKAFDIAGYSQADVENEFGGMLSAFRFGAPPHGGIAPGVDRIVMLLANQPNIREVIAFPMNQQAQDLLMGAPSEVPESHLKELCLKIDLPKEIK